ncbi:MAG: TatD family deoxyribonuclease [Rhodospirillales bacterium]|nr:TatD family deoxyribonuclease [Rhodospirillales bacterium]
MLVDSHCHLDFPDFAQELDAVVARAGAAGIGTMLTIGTKVSEFPRVLAVAERYENVFCTVGIHPHEAGREPGTTADDLVRMAEHPKVVGFGETGLDFYYEHSPRDAQEKSFRAHAAAARAAGLPLIVHSRDADGETSRILQEEHAKGPFMGLVHCFTGGRGLAEAALAIGFHISFSGIVTFKKADDLRAIARDVPADRIMVETDSPYLAPVPMRGKRNEPAFAVHTAAVLAGLRGVPEADFNAATTETFFRLFTKATRKP